MSVEGRRSVALDDAAIMHTHVRSGRQSLEPADRHGVQQRGDPRGIARYRARCSATWTRPCGSSSKPKYNRLALEFCLISLKCMDITLRPRAWDRVASLLSQPGCGRSSAKGKAADFDHRRR